MEIGFVACFPGLFGFRNSKLGRIKIVDIKERIS